MPRKDLSNQKFGRLLVVKYDGQSISRHSVWKCLCDCGSTVRVMGKYLLSGKTTSCGCFRRETASAQHSTHGDSGTRLYNIWSGIKSRCYNPNRENFKNYGGRSITMCDAWQVFEDFKKWALDNGYSDELTIGRIDNDSAYSPENCRWETPKQQARNTRRNIMIDGLCLSDWCAIMEIPQQAIISRLHRGWDLERALSTPLPKRSA